MQRTPNRRAVLITGAAGGIGAAVAEEFASRGDRVALVDRNGDGLEAACGRIAAAGGEALAIEGDLADLRFAESAVRAAARRFGRLDVLVNNAGARELTTMRDISPGQWDATVRLCLTVPAFLARWCAEEMESQGGGVVVNMGSMMARQAHGLSPAYVACKGALESLTYDLAALYGPQGIRVVTIAPGAIDTALIPLSGGADHAAIREFSESMTMLGRWGTPAEVARAVAWIASDEASYLTGTTLVLDGGWSRMHMPPDITRRIAVQSSCGASSEATRRTE
jgi:3-oxoacyl-[acyl-carrier protein] reductase